MKKDLYDTDVYSDCLRRMHKLTVDTPAAWGSMNAAQMLAHCAEVAEVNNGKPLLNTPFLIRLMGKWIKKLVLSDKPYSKAGRTHGQYVMEGSHDFEKEKSRLLDALEQFRTMRDAGQDPPDHPLFGPMTREERGWAMFKHLDHHFRQFGV